jgi:hypothetical protein
LGILSGAWPSSWGRGGIGVLENAGARSFNFSVPLGEPSKIAKEQNQKLLLYFELMSSQKLILYFIWNTEEVIIKVVDTPSLATSGKWI